MAGIKIVKSSPKMKRFVFIYFVVLIILCAVVAYYVGNTIEELVNTCYDSSDSYCYKCEFMDDGYYKIMIDSTHSLVEKQLLDSTSSFYSKVRKKVKKKDIQGFWLLFVDTSSSQLTVQYSALIQRNDILNVNLNNIKTYQEFKNLIRWQ